MKKDNESSIPKDLYALYERALKERKLLTASSPPWDTGWFTPSQILNQWKKGNFLWGSENWQLIDPQYVLDDIAHALLEIQRRRSQFLKTIEQENW